MKVFLDDKRDCPEGWILAKTYKKAIKLLETGEVTEMSLDHDLGSNKTGYDVLIYIEQKMHKEIFTVPKLRVHTSNPPARIRMRTAIEAIEYHSKNNT